MASLSLGCQLSRRASWHEPHLAKPRILAGARHSGREGAERTLAEALRLEKQGDAHCVDYYFAAATQVWPDVQQQLAEQGRPSGRAGDLYRSALTGLISSGQTFRRFDPRSGLVIQSPGGPTTVPTRYVGFAWQPRDFDRLVPIGHYQAKDLKNEYHCSGLGVATVVIRCRRPNERFRLPRQFFGATVVLRPCDVTGTSSCPIPFVLELHDPLRVRSTIQEGVPVALERDTTGPIAYVLSQEDQNWLEGFLQPGTSDENVGLFMTEPYQPGKIPLLLVHGLLSDPLTWASVANEIRAQPDLVDRYQLWGFEYATGEPFLTSAAMLRRQLRQIRQYLDPGGTDPALSQMVLVGHSMGGLVSKLQITRSGTTLWEAVSCVPLEQVLTTSQTRQDLAEAFFFEPSADVSRVVFIGTPHRGSPWARRPIGRFGSRLVDEPASSEAAHQQLIRDNPNVFSEEFSERIPTSIDLLEPSSPLLQAVDRLPLKDCVPFHSILGEGYWMIGAGNSDSVVPVSSARKPGAASEKAVHAKHTQLNRDSGGIEELFRILRAHARDAGIPQ